MREHGATGGSPGKALRSLVEGAFCFLFFPHRMILNQEPTPCSASAPTELHILLSKLWLPMFNTWITLEHITQPKPSVRCRQTHSLLLLQFRTSSSGHGQAEPWQPPEQPGVAGARPVPGSVGIQPGTSCVCRAWSRAAPLKQCLCSQGGCAQSHITW